MKYLTLLIFTLLLGFGIWNLYQLKQTFNTETALKYDYAEAHQLKYGLFNLDIWKEKIFGILQKRVGTFKLKSSDFDVIEREVENYLNGLYKDYFESGKIIEYVMKESKDDKNSVAKILMGLFKGGIEKQIQEIDFKSKIPGLAKQLTSELKKKSPEIQKAISKEISNMIASEAKRTLVDQRNLLYEKYEVSNVSDMDAKINESLLSIKDKKKQFILWSILALMLGALLCFLASQYISFNISMLWLTVYSTIFLIGGLSLPMIDLDARLSEVDMSIMDEAVHFDEQVLYFQSKSIFDVTETLLKGNGLDLKIVGLLILLFSIVLPLLKMILTTLYLFVQKSRNNKFIETIIFYLGKWSMADVFVVAIFMSYIGFQGLINSQLGDMSQQSAAYRLETVNYSKLSPGIIYFTIYVVLSVAMSSVIHRKLKATT